MITREELKNYKSTIIEENTQKYKRLYRKYENDIDDSIRWALSREDTEAFITLTDGELAELMKSYYKMYGIEYQNKDYKSFLKNFLGEYSKEYKITVEKLGNFGSLYACMFNCNETRLLFDISDNAEKGITFKYIDPYEYNKPPKKWWEFWK